MDYLKFNDFFYVIILLFLLRLAQFLGTDVARLYNGGTTLLRRRAANRGATSRHRLDDAEAKRTLPSRTSPASCPFFLRCPPLLTGVHCLSEVSFYFLSSLLSLLSFSIMELLLLSVQCANLVPAYPCSVRHQPYNNKQHSLQCSLCKAWTVQALQREHCKE